MRRFASALPAYAGALAGIAVTSGCMWAARAHLSLAPIALVHLFAVFCAATRWGIGPAIAASVLAFVALDYLFTQPVFSLAVAAPSELVSLLVFLAVASLTSRLVAGARGRAREAERHARQSAALLRLSEATIGARDTPAVLQAVVDVAADVFGTRCGAILLPDALDALRVSASSPAGEPCPLTREEEGIADYVWRHQSRVPHGGALYAPVTLGAERLGVLRLGPRANGEALPHDDLRLLEAFARGAAAAIDRRRLLEAATQAEVLRRSDALKTALLGTVSHDLRTPLAALKTGITALLQGDVRWDRQAQLEILSASNDEVDRLTRLISNVLDLSRIEAGALVPDRQWYEIGELINDSVRRAGAGLEAHLVAVDIADGDLPMNVDYVQMQQVLANLLDNAAKYSPAGSRIRVTGGVEGAAYVIRVHDAGPGIPASEADRIFSKFYRLAGRRTGTGLGLAICKGLVDAHGGCIAVENPGRPGAVFAVSLPIAERPAMTPSAV